MSCAGADHNFKKEQGEKYDKDNFCTGDWGAVGWPGGVCHAGSCLGHITPINWEINNPLTGIRSWGGI